MRRIKGGARTVAAGGVLLLCVLAGVGMMLVSCAHTPSIRASAGRVPVATLERVELGGVPQCILVRGEDRDAPILVFVHGGPGMPMMFLAHAFQRDLERDFLIVHWDQRGAGKSYDPDISVDSIRVSQYLEDLESLVMLLRERYGERPVYLAGHSWGTYLGVLAARRRPDLYAAYIGIGQIVSGTRARVLQDAFIREQAAARNTPEAITDLDRHGAGAHEKWLFRFNGELRGADSMQPLISTGLRAPEYSLLDALDIRKGVALVGSNMKYDVIEGDLADVVTGLDVPVYFFLGRHDMTTPSVLAEEYARTLRAPRASVVWFEESAHFPFFEEPEAFAAAMRMVLAETQAAPR